MALLPVKDASAANAVKSAETAKVAAAHARMATEIAATELFIEMIWNAFLK